MSDTCPELERLAKIADGRLEDAGAAHHVLGCDRCTLTVNELQRITGLLTALGRVEARHPADAVRLWTAVESKLDSPSWRPRVPLALADWSRVVSVFTQPRVAAAWATCIAGICLGIWLPRVDGNGSSAFSYAESSLVDETAAGLADLYAESFAAGFDAGAEDTRERSDAFGDDPPSREGDSTDAHD